MDDPTIILQVAPFPSFSDFFLNSQNRYFGVEFYNVLTPIFCTFVTVELLWCHVHVHVDKNPQTTAKGPHSC